MIIIDLLKGLEGSMSGDLGTLIEEYSIISSYIYGMMMSESKKNDKIFDNLIKEAKKNAKGIDKNIFKDNKKERNIDGISLEEVTKMMEDFHKKNN